MRLTHEGFVFCVPAKVKFPGPGQTDLYFDQITTVMEDLIKLNNQSNGRDKLVRLAQYVSRLVWHQLELRSANKYSVDRFKNLELSFSTCRKILRFGRCADALYAALGTLHIDDWRLRSMIASSKIAHALYLYADHVVWLARSGFVRVDSDRWNRVANKFWLLSIVMNLARDLYEILHLLQHHHSALLKPSGLLEPMRNFKPSECARHIYLLVNCHKDVFIDTLKNSCDLFIPLAALGMVKLSPSSVGALGAVSSLAALITILKPITKLVPM